MMADENADIIKTIAEAVNGIGDYLRKQAEKNRDSSSWAETQDLPQPIDVPTTDNSAGPKEVEDVVIPLPRRPQYDEGYMLPDDADATAADSGIFAFVGHYAAAAAGVTEAAFWTKAGCLNSFITIGLDVRKCTSDAPTGDHPGYQKALMAGAPLAGVAWGNPISTRSGDDYTWFDLAYSLTDPDGNDLGHGTEVMTGLKIQAQISSAGELALRVDNQTATWGVSLDITGVVWRVAVPVLTVGTQIEFGANTCHEGSATPPNAWGDGIWTPEP